MYVDIVQKTFQALSTNLSVIFKKLFTKLSYQRDGYSIEMGGARGVMVIVAGNEHSDTSSNPGRDWLHFT